MNCLKCALHMFFQKYYSYKHEMYYISVHIKASDSILYMYYVLYLLYLNVTVICVLKQHFNICMSTSLPLVS